MKQGKTLQELAATIQQHADMKSDYVTDIREVVMHPETSGLTITGVEDQISPTDHCHAQIAAFTGIGNRYYRKMLEESPQLLSGNVNHWLHQDPDDKPVRRMVRTMDGVGRAFLSDHYLRVDNEQIAETALKAFQDVDHLEIASCDVTDNKLYIKALFPRTQREVTIGDAVQSGVLISNSEIGSGRFRIDPFWMRLWCLNGCASMQKGNGFSRIHRGSRIENDGIVYQQDTVEAATKAILLQCRDAVTQFADPNYFEKFVEQLTEATQGEKIEHPVRAVEVLGKAVGFSKEEGEGILERLIRGEDYSRYGMLNAVTNLANETPDYDRATELEYLGGRILDLSRSQWNTVAIAA